MPIPKVPKITGKTLKEWADNLMTSGDGCCSFRLTTDIEGNDWFILMGFADGYDITAPGPWQIGTWALNTMVGYQSIESVLRCDLTMDFAQPFNPATGEVADTMCTLPDSPDWDSLAKDLNSKAIEILTEYASFDDME